MPGRSWGPSRQRTPQSRIEEQRPGTSDPAVAVCLHDAAVPVRRELVLAAWATLRAATLPLFSKPLSVSLSSSVRRTRYFSIVLLGFLISANRSAWAESSISFRTRDI